MEGGNGGGGAIEGANGGGSQPMWIPLLGLKQAPIGSLDRWIPPPPPGRILVHREGR
jgi:hypothetical protein